MPIKAVVFDVGETLIDESRMWRGWASYLGVPDREFIAALEDVIASGDDHRAVFARFRPGLDLSAARRERAARGDNDIFRAQDLYPDAAPCLRELRNLGYRIGIAGNQPADAVAALQSLDLAADFVAASATLGVAKPSGAFFEKVVAMAGVAARETAYVGDRLDNDILPARTSGLATVFLLRGPWAKVHMHRPDAALASATLSGLTGLADVLARLND